MSNQPVIQAQGLCRRQGQRWVLLHLDFDLQAGESLLVAGGNGAGKSTLLRLLSTLTPPSHGDLAIFGASVRQTRRPQRARIGLLGHANQLYHELTPEDHLRLWGQLSGKSVPSTLLERVGLSSRRHDAVRTVSAGMCKRLALARLLLLDPDLVLLDEPFGQLDSSGVTLMEQVVSDWRQANKTVVLATHLLERGKPLCDRALLLAHGQLTWQGPADELTASRVAGGAQ